MRISFSRVPFSRIPFRRGRSRSVAEELVAVRASRREIVQAFELERRRIERDLHDGAQQYIVASNMAVGEALMMLEMAIPAGADSNELGADAYEFGADPHTPSVDAQRLHDSSPEAQGDSVCIQLSIAQMRDLHAALKRAQSAGEQGLTAIRAAVNNIHPKVLSDIGLEAAVRGVAQSMCGASQSGDGAGQVYGGRSQNRAVSQDSVVSQGTRARVRVIVPHRLPDMPEGVAATAYFFVAEALTNAAKYAPGASVSVILAADEHLHVSVVDTGSGGAQVRPGHGLAGLRERLAAFGGSLRVDSPLGGPTTVAALIPLLLQPGESGIVGAYSDTQEVGER